MTTLRLNGSHSGDIETAALLLRQGAVVAIPTETVYGLAADALNGDAVAGIFAAKGRPADNPLIVHIAQLHQLHALCDQVSPQALALAQAYWPGPLTMVLKRREGIPAIVTGGLDTVGVRMPSHPVAAAIITAADRPLAAPSANISGTPSPTRAEHVLGDFEGRIAAVVDGGLCEVGLESTVVDMTGPQPVILRPGAVTAQMIARVCGSAEDRSQPVENGVQPRSPGLKYRHYAPRAPMTLFQGPMAATGAAILEQGRKDWGVLCFEEYVPQLQAVFGHVQSLGTGQLPALHARRLYDALRELDAAGPARILAQSPRPWGLGAATVNRLERAAAHQTVDCTGGRLVIGVTGRSGSGKGIFAARLAAGEGAVVLDADRIYNRLLRENEEMKAQLFSCFPEARVDDQVDKGRLGQLVFTDPAKRRRLNDITHGFVRQAMEAGVALAPSKLVILDVPLLFESGIDHLCDLTVGILADANHAAARIMSRDSIPLEKALLRLNAQPEAEYYQSRCDVTLENYENLTAFEKKIQAFYQKYVTDSLK